MSPSQRAAEVALARAGGSDLKHPTSLLERELIGAGQTIGEPGHRRDVPRACIGVRLAEVERPGSHLELSASPRVHTLPPVSRRRGSEEHATRYGGKAVAR